MHLYKNQSAYTEIIHYSPTRGEIPDDQSCILEEATPREERSPKHDGKPDDKSRYFLFFSFPFFSFFFGVRTKEAR